MFLLKLPTEADLTVVYEKKNSNTGLKIILNLDTFSSLLILFSVILLIFF
jgi:hypothetical protein